mmetsp:Transcript_3040/g.8242  ORF Transcript_3040/g.8242 Transcript_3040/m.8242 type:complete len:548 (-) Transcript_3040:51-1694(-)
MTGGKEERQSTLLGLFRRREGEVSRVQQESPRKVSRSPIRIGTRKALGSEKGGGGEGGDHQLMVHTASGARPLEPTLASVLDGYWTDYSAVMDGMKRAQRAKRPRGRGHHGVEEEEGGVPGRPKGTMHERDGLRFIEILSKQCSTRPVRIPHDAVEKVLTMVENHPNHDALLSHEAYLCLRRLHAARPPTKVVRAEGDSLQVIVDVDAWTPLSMDRCVESDEAMPGMDGGEGGGKTPRGGIGRRSRDTAWHMYSGKVEELLAMYERYEVGDVSESEDSGTSAGVVLSLKHLTEILGNDLEDRARICAYYHSLPRAQALEKTGCELKHVMFTLTSSVVHSLISLTHKTVDGGNNKMSLRSFVQKVVQLRLMAARFLKGDRESSPAPELSREIFEVAGRIFNILCTLFSETELCLDHSHYGTFSNDRKLLDNWVIDLFFNRQIMQTSWDRNVLLQAFESPKHKLQFIGELFVQYVGKQANIPDNLVTLKEAVKMKDTMTMSYSVEEDEVLEYIKVHAKNAIASLELIDNATLLISHTFHAKLRLIEDRG